MILTNNVQVVYKSGRKHIYPNCSDFYYYFSQVENKGYFILSSLEFKSHQKYIAVDSIKSIGFTFK